MDMGYCVQYFIYFQGYWVFRKTNLFMDIFQFIMDTCIFISREMGYFQEEKKVSCLPYISDCYMNLTYFCLALVPLYY